MSSAATGCCPLTSDAEQMEAPQLRLGNRGQDVECAVVTLV